MQAPPNIRVPYEIKLPKSKTLYSLSLEASNRHGNAFSSGTNITSAHGMLNSTLLRAVVKGGGVSIVKSTM